MHIRIQRYIYKYKYICMYICINRLCSFLLMLRHGVTHIDTLHKNKSMQLRRVSFAGGEGDGR